MNNIIKISSTNCRGLGDITKRRDVFNYLRSKKHSICCLQDTHFTESLEPYIRAEWGGEVFFSSFTSNARGVCILFNNNVDFKVFKSKTDQNGNVLALDLELEGKRITLISIYGPNNDSPEFYSNLCEIIEDFDNETTMICGDFNLVQNQDLDTDNYIHVNNPRAKQRILDLKEELSLVDPYRELYSETKQFTWRKKNPIKQARLDFFLLTETLMSSLSDVNIIPSYRSDHSSVVLSLEINEFKKGKGIWKFNTSLLKDRIYVEEIKKVINTTIEQYMIPVYDIKYFKDNIENDSLQLTISDKLFLEVLLMEIRGKTISHSAYRKKQKNQREGNLIAEIEHLENSVNQDLNLIETKKEELEKVRKEKIQGIIVRSRIKWAEEGEKPTKYFCSLESRNYVNKIIPKIVKEDGTLITQQDEILTEVKDFYSKLYKIQKINQHIDTQRLFQSLNSSPKLNNDDKDKLEGEITIDEISIVLKNMKNNKSPGTDGFSAEFFKFFFIDLKCFIKRAINEGYREGKLSITQRQGLITCLPKGDKPKQFMKNWRPITLLNVIYKLASGCIAERIKSILTKLISEDQTGFLSGRYIGENTRLMYDIIHLTDTLDIPGLLLIVDFEKAFDSISWNFIMQVLNFFNFGQSIKKWIKVFYNDISSSVIQNGFISDSFPVQRGCRQGDPLSPYIFLLCAEILALMLKENKDIKGITIGDTEYKLSQFADDTTMLLDGSEKSLHETFIILQRYAETSGLKVNDSKTRAVWIGSKKFSGETFNHRFKLDWSQTDFTILGIKFSCNLDTIIDINFNEKITQIEKELKQWSKRILTPFGRITILKTLIIAKLNHLFIALPDPSEEMITKLNTLCYNFIWQAKTDKIKRDILIQEYNKGGLKMIHLRNYISALKIGWIRRLINSNSKYKTLFEHMYTNVEMMINRGETYIEDIKKDCKNKFWIDVLSAWKNYCSVISPENVDDVMGINLWNNKNIKINNETVFLKKWYDRNINFIKDLINDNGTFLTFTQFVDKYEIQTNFLEFYGIKSVVENYVRRIGIHFNSIVLTNILLPFNVKGICKNKKGCKDMYEILNSKVIVAKNELKWNTVFENVQLNWKIIYDVPAKCCSNTKLHWFQYRIMHRILGTNDLLTKMNIKQNNLCTFCLTETEKIEHLFWQCNVVNQFWEQVNQWIYTKGDYMLNINKYRAIFGMPQTNLFIRPINYILILTRYYIYKCKMKNTNLDIRIWENDVKQFIAIEKSIAIKNDRYEKFEKTWGKWMITFDID